MQSTHACAGFVWIPLSAHSLKKRSNMARKLKVNDPIVLIITSSPHRKEAFKANEYIIDFLKTNAPFWKKENTEKRSYWVNQKD